jgi:subtilisin family serine protease
MRTGGFAVLALIALVLGATASASTEPVRTTEFVPGEVIVRFKPGLGFESRQGILRAESARLDKRLGLPGAGLVKLPPGESVAAAVNAFERHADVLYAQPNYVYHAAAIPSDPFFGTLWALHNLGQPVDGVSGTDDADIDAPEAWSLTTGSDAVKVAVVDTGVEYDHPDLAGNIAELGPDYYSGDLDPRDENGHGTHVAGTIGAQGNNGVGVSGVNWDVGLMPIRVLGPTGSGTTAMIAKGFAYAAQHGAKVVNASLGGGTFDPTLADTIGAAAETLFVVAAGNGGADRVGDDNDLAGQQVYPCSYALANVVCAAATDLSDGLASFSNYGATSVDLAAPGVRIGSTYVGGTYVQNQGTSMAAPHVAGVAALLLARDPAASVATLRAALLSSVDPLPALGGKVVSAGRLNAHKALLAITPASAPLPLPPSPQPEPRSPLEASCLVPNLKGKTVGQARRLLKVTRCALGAARPAYSKRVRKGRIISQSRRPAARFLLGTRVNVFVSRGRRPLQKHPRLREVPRAVRPIASL